MMKKIRIWAIAILSVMVLSAVLIYWLYSPKPAAFPTNKQLITEINQVHPEASASVIQDTLFIDERHKFVPFISVKGNYGSSFWEWIKNKWEPVCISTMGDPNIWKIKNDDPSSYFIVWNLHPDDQVSYLKFYLIKDRDFYGSNGVETYNPRIQMEKKVTLQKKSYGVLPMPKQWAGAMNSIIKVEKSKAPDDFFNIGPTNLQMHFSWTPYDKSDKEADIRGSANGSSVTNGGDGNIDYIMYVTPRELESPIKK